MTERNSSENSKKKTNEEKKRKIRGRLTLEYNVLL
jgi:hypothetical protein